MACRAPARRFAVSTGGAGVRFLFVKTSLPWPRATGPDVHASEMMKALASLGHEVGLATVDVPDPRALADLPLTLVTSIPADTARPHLSRLQEKFRSYYGIHSEHVAGVARLAREFKADTVVAVGLEVLPYLCAVRDAHRVWYAADEWVRHHLTQARHGGAWQNVKDALVKGVYERAFAPVVDRVWVVSERERRAMRWFGGMRAIDVVPNGVDAEYFTPSPAEEIPHSHVFWGRLDFGPNIQALQWFCRDVWPGVREGLSGASFTIIGFNPTDEVRQLARVPGVRLLGALPDLRHEVARHGVIVLPFVSGGGIKNKLLEAAALGKPILGTPRALEGIAAADDAPLLTARTPSAWTTLLSELWRDAGARVVLGTATREWVVRNHQWEASARAALRGLAED